MSRWLPKLDSEKFPALTGLRAIAAYLVFFHHYTPDAPIVARPVYNFLAEGHVGVTLFYVLSGFLITYNYHDQARGLTARFWKQYMIRRFARIYPLYILLLTVTFLWPVVVQHHTPPDFLTLTLNITLLKGFFEAFLFSGIAPSWSLTVEETFYATAPFLFVLLRKWRLPRVQLLLYSIGTLLLLVGSNIDFYGFFGNFRFVALYTFFGRSFEFLAGMCLAQFLLMNPEALKKAPAILFTWTGSVGCVLVVLWLSLLRKGTTFGLFHSIGMALNNFAFPLFACILFCGLITERTIISRVLGSRVAILLGRCSYAFYLVHFGLLSNLTLAQLGPFPHPWRILVLFIAVNLISVFLYALVEHPANVFIRRLAEPVRHIRTVQSSRNSHRECNAVPRQLIRLHRYAWGWSALFVLTFGGWCAFTAARVNARTIGDQDTITPLGRLVSARTDFATVTSRVGVVSGLTYRVGGLSIAHGTFIFAHANSTLVFDLTDQRFSRFDFSTGLDDAGGADRGSVIYVVRGDGRILFTSPVIRAMQRPQQYSVNIVGTRKIELSITDAGDGITSDEAYWIDPALRE